MTKTKQSWKGPVSSVRSRPMAANYKMMKSPREYSWALSRQGPSVSCLPVPGSCCSRFPCLPLTTNELQLILQGVLRGAGDGSAGWQIDRTMSWPFRRRYKNQQYQAGVLKSSKCLLKTTTNLELTMCQVLFKNFSSHGIPVIILRNKHHYGYLTGEETEAA